MVDGRLRGVPKNVQGRIRRSVLVRIDPRRLDTPVPQVTVDVIGKAGRRKESNASKEDRRSDDKSPPEKSLGLFANHFQDIQPEEKGEEP